jgi:catechol 2,3-dioxygenase-like lactoylglutathione lyase family enzyme
VKLHHVAIGAHDVHRVAEFYRRAFDLPERARHLEPDGRLRSVWLDASGVILMIEASGALERRVEGIGAGPFLLAFEVPSEQHREIEERLEALGAELEQRTEFSSYTRDPEGNRVAISHYPAP